jgi:hypothetical protein
MIVLDEKVHEQLRRIAYTKNISMAEVARRAIEKYAGVEEKK